MLRYSPYIIVFHHHKDHPINAIVNFIVKQILVARSSYNQSVYCSSLVDNNLIGYAGQEVVILNDLFTAPNLISQQLSVFTQLSSNSVFVTSYNRYKEPIYFNSKLIIVITPNPYPLIDQRYNLLAARSNLWFKHYYQQNRFERLKPEILIIDIETSDKLNYYRHRFNLPFVDLLTIDSVVNVSSNAYINFVSRCSENW